MTREELKEHCKKEIEMCKFWAHGKDEELDNNKIYQEHKLVLELLEQEPDIGKIRADIEELPTETCTETCIISIHADDFKKNVLDIIDKHKAEFKPQEGVIKE